jgi:hypothetical protein
VRKRIFVVVSTISLLLLTAFGALRIAPYFIDGSDYDAVASIETRADFRDPALLRAAWRLPVAAAYSSQPFEYQTNASFCGPASAANLLRSIGIDMSQDEVIDGTQYDSLIGVLVGGMTLDQFADLMRARTHADVTVIRDATLAEFREHLLRANDPARRYVVNFHRGPLFGRGHGHFSPILGYDVARDLVFVGDVNREYRPFLVSSERLWNATNTLDSATGKNRGLLAVVLESRQPAAALTILR